jgi:hypothetical protein
MNTHSVKSWPEFFGPVISNVKTFELRRADRDYQVGDRLHLREWEPQTESYTGRECWRMIEYVLEQGPGLLPGYCVLGLK